MKTLHYAGYQPEASGFGWATCNKNLWLALSQHFDMIGGDIRSLIGPSADVVFMPLADHDLNPISAARGKINIAYTFFEYPLGEKAVENAKQYDTVFCGSTWCLDRMIERGITNGKVLVQGVDHAVFKPRAPILFAEELDKTIPVPDGDITGIPWQFRIFSGGKFEWRKGQDLVIRAFAEFAKTHPGAHLVCAWHNPWPQLAWQTMILKSLACNIDASVIEYDSLEHAFKRLMHVNGIPSDRFTILPQLPQADLAREMQNTDIGLFPNRCEGGTNLVLMEYAACGGKVVANTKTGHADVAMAIDIAIRADVDEMSWAAQKVEDIVSALEIAYSARNLPRHQYAIEQTWTWENAAQTVANEIERLAGTK